MEKKRFVIGSRGSKLAMIQSNWVKSTLESRLPGVEVVISEISTKGDRITDVPLSRLGGVGLFTKELENALLGMEIDLAVHSAKDMPAELPDGLVVGAFSRREDPHDVFIGKDNQPLGSLAEGGVIGTSSLRRKAQLLAKMPGVQIADLRGNLDTRVRKVKEGAYDGIVVACAGLNRMGVEGVDKQIISFDCMLPAVGQGALGIEIREGDDETAALIQLLNDPFTNIAVTSERALLRTLQGGCQIPVGAIGEIVSGEQVRLRAMVSSLDGTSVVRDEITGGVDRASEIGVELAQRLLADGAEGILRKIRDSLSSGGL